MNASPPDESRASSPSAGTESPPEAEPRSVTSETLLRGGRELVIQHMGRNYRLCLTSRNKLILVA